MSPERQISQHKRDQEAEQHRDRGAERQTVDAAIGEEIETARHAADGPQRIEQRDTLQDRTHAERDDQGMHAQRNYKPGIDATDQRPEHQHGDHHGNDAIRIVVN